MPRRHRWCSTLFSVCSRVRHRRFTWLCCLIVVVIVVMFLPLHLDPIPLGAVTTPFVKVIISELDPKQTMIEDIDKRFLPIFMNYSILTDNYPDIYKIYLNKSKQEDIFTNSWCKEDRFGENRTTLPTATLILSLNNLISAVDALLILRQNLEHFLSPIIDDVIITAEKALPRSLKEQIEEFVDLCSFCRLFFFSGNIYRHRNEAAKFARNNYLLFVDGRVRLTRHWLQPFLKFFQSDNIAVSPQVRLQYADGSGNSDGFSRNDVTWDFGVIRTEAGAKLLQDARESGLNYFNQTIISTEFFGISKNFFTHLGGFDVFPDATGGEHVTFSLKVLSCGGNVVTLICSHVFLIIQKFLGKSGNKISNEFLEFRSPTFNTSQNNITAYYIAGSKPYLDGISRKYFICSLKNQFKMDDLRSVALLSSKTFGRFRSVNSNIYSSRKFKSYGKIIQQRLTISKCQDHNLRNIIIERQPDILAPTKFATYYGYIRTTDNMYAFGMQLNNYFTTNTNISGISAQIPRNPINIPAWGSFILTRNSSLWMGPFSFTNGAVIYKNVWCITVGRQSELTLSRCVKGKPNQAFVYMDNMITPAGVGTSCACVKQTLDSSNEVLMMPISEKDCVKHFKFDVEFTENCLK